MSQLIRILVVLLVLLIALVIAAMTYDDNGYVFVEFNGWVIEMNVWSLGLTIIAIFVGLMFLNWLIKFVISVTSGSKNWLWNWGYRKKQRAFRQGLLALAEADFLAAKKQLSKIDNEDFNGINLLAAAQAQWQLGEQQAAKNTWQLARQNNDSALAATIHLTRLALHQQQPQQALELIKDLPDKHQSQPVVIKLWAQALVEAGLWQVLQDKLKGWKKPLDQDYDELMLKASKGYFAEIASKEGASELKQVWQSLPRATRKDPAQQAAYIQQLIAQGMHGDAEKALVDFQSSEPNPLLLPLFKQIKLPNPAQAIKKLENWLKKDDLNVALLSALGHLAFNAGDNQLAEKALAKAIKLDNRVEDILLLAKLKESQGEQITALELYKECFMLQSVESQAS